MGEASSSPPSPPSSSLSSPLLSSLLRPLPPLPLPPLPLPLLLRRRAFLALPVSIPTGEGSARCLGVAAESRLAAGLDRLTPVTASTPPPPLPTWSSSLKPCGSMSKSPSDAPGGAGVYSICGSRSDDGTGRCDHLPPLPRIARISRATSATVCTSCESSEARSEERLIRLPTVRSKSNSEAPARSAERKKSRQRCVVGRQGSSSYSSSKCAWCASKWTSHGSCASGITCGCLSSSAQWRSRLHIDVR
mmetsp:Transcript_2190/g.7062  ORF Transcript_2190/g.7062 Transcript_2190/m.7062 type:complete len:248 (-) Transcript_2190:354-1097(-)